MKAVSELYSPVPGEVVEVNGALDGDPAVVNRDPYGDGWMVALRVTDASSLAGLLSPSQDPGLDHALVARGIHLINDPYQHRHAHHLPSIIRAICCLHARVVRPP